MYSYIYRPEKINAQNRTYSHNVDALTCMALVTAGHHGKGIWGTERLDSEFTWGHTFKHIMIHLCKLLWFLNLKWGHFAGFPFRNLQIGVCWCRYNLTRFINDDVIPFVPPRNRKHQKWNSSLLFIVVFVLCYLLIFWFPVPNPNQI